MPFVWPDPLAPPTEEESNPHFQRSREGEIPTSVPRDNPTPFTDAVFPRLVVEYDDLIGNMAQNQVDVINAAPGNYMAVLVYGAGNTFFATHPKIHTQIRDFIVSLNVRETSQPDAEQVPSGDLDLSLPVWKNKPDMKRNYNKPWTIVLSGATESLRQFLLWHQTFAISPDLTFSVLPFDRSLRSWVIMNISGDAVRQGSEGVVLAEVKRKLWASAAFRGFTDRILAKSGVPGSANERAVRATATFTVTMIEFTDAAGDPTPVLQLLGRPITPDRDVHKQWLRIIREQEYWIGLKKLVIDKKFVDCVGCKSATHPAFDCPFLRTEGWYGPSRDDISHFEKRAADARKASPNEGSSRGRGGRGGRGGGGSRRGNGGWQVVQRGGKH